MQSVDGSFFNINLHSRSMPSPFEFIFVVGCPRSGTTVLGEFLGQQKNTISLGEGNVFRDLCNLSRSVLRDDIAARSMRKSIVLPNSFPVDEVGRLVDKLYKLLGAKSNVINIDHTP